MQQSGWNRYLVAAAVVLIFGAIWVLAGEGEVEIKVRNQDGRQITIDVNGETEVVNLDDLDEGEALDYEVGGRTFTVRRLDDHLLMDHGAPGKQLVFVGEDRADDLPQVWVTADEGSEPGSRQVVVMKRGDGDEVGFDIDVAAGDVHGARSFVVISGDEGEIDVEALKERYGDDFEEIVKDDGTRILKWVGEGHQRRPALFYSFGDGGTELVRYRCDETGSMLIVTKEEGLLDSYIDPVTGCLMEKVEDGIGIHVVKIREKVDLSEDE